MNMSLPDDLLSLVLLYEDAKELVHFAEPVTRHLHSLIITSRTTSLSAQQMQQEIMLRQMFPRPPVRVGKVQYAALMEYLVTFGEHVPTADERLKAYQEVFDSSAEESDIEKFPLEFLDNVVFLRFVQQLLRETLSKINSMNRPPSSQAQRGLTVDLKRGTITRDGICYVGLPSGSAKLVQILLDADEDEWISGDTMASKMGLPKGAASKIKKRLPKPIQDLIEARRSLGFRLRRELLSS